MRKLNKVADQKRDNIIAASVRATAHAEANPNDKDAQRIANALSDAALAGRKLADHLRYNRSDY